MSKQPLGRGLGELMKAAEKALPADGSCSTDSKGLKQMLAQPASPPATAPPRFLPLWFLLILDLLLLVVSFGVAWMAPKPLEAGVILFLCVSVGLGGGLSVLGFLKGR